MSPPRILLLAVVLAGVLAAGFCGPTPTLARAAACSDYANQAAAQAAGDTRDSDGDGIFCESLPCPCSTAAPGTTSSPTTTPGAPTPKPEPADPAGCRTPAGVQNITFSETKYPNIRKHFLRALRRGWPRTLVLNRPGAAQRRARLLEGVATKPGYDRDEYPPAVARGRGRGLTRGSDPTGWPANVALVPSAENRSHGSTMGLKLRRFCSGTKFRYVFY